MCFQACKSAFQLMSTFMLTQALVAQKLTCSAMSHSPGTPAHTPRKRTTMSESLY